MKYPSYTPDGLVMVDGYTIDDMRYISNEAFYRASAYNALSWQYDYMIDYFMKRPEMLVGTEYGNNADEVRLTRASKKTDQHDYHVQQWIRLIEQVNSEKRM